MNINLLLFSFLALLLFKFYDTRFTECGLLTPRVSPLVIGGKSARRGELPWHVAVYRKTTNPFQQICGGSIISADVVISAAHCFWDFGLNRRFPAVNFAVAAGKIYSPWDERADYNAQFLNVTEIVIPDIFCGEDRNYADDIAMMVLERPLKFRPYIRPVCLDFNFTLEETQLRNGQLGKVAGWGAATAEGLVSTVLKTVELPYIDLTTCLRHTPPLYWEALTGDKFCAGYNNGTTLCHGDSGGGLVFARRDDNGASRYYLRGVVSTKPSRYNNCVATVVTFTRVARYASFISQRVNLTINERTADLRKCVLPDIPQHGSYTVEDEPTVQPGDKLSSVILNVTCNPGYWLSDSASVFCVRGKWHNPMPLCLGCGKEGPRVNPVVANGQNVSIGELPWHVAVYKRKGDETQYVCGGTIISPTLVVSAAHCFWNTHHRSLRPAGDFLVMAGKIFSLWNEKKDIHAQYSFVSEIASNFRGQESKYKDDIALLLLSDPFQFKPYLRPVCVDFDLEFERKQLQKGNEGKIGGWGLTNLVFNPYATTSDTLKSALLPFQNRASCQLPHDFDKTFFTSDKFCAGSNTTTLLNGDSGGGLVYPETTRGGGQRYFLRGVASIGPAVTELNDVHVPTLFTRLSTHRDFIERYYRLG